MRAAALERIERHLDTNSALQLQLSQAQQRLVPAQSLAAGYLSDHRQQSAHQLAAVDQLELALTDSRTCRTAHAVQTAADAYPRDGDSSVATNKHDFSTVSAVELQLKHMREERDKATKTRQQITNELATFLH